MGLLLPSGESMKRREMNALARSLCEYLFSRNNDINGYWGIGMLCSLAKVAKKSTYSFKIRPGKSIAIYGCEISESKAVTDEIIKYKLDTIEARMSFFEDGRYPNGNERFTCALAIAVTQEGRTGMYMSNIDCWPHDSTRESRRVKFLVKEKMANAANKIIKIYKIIENRFTK